MKNIFISVKGWIAFTIIVIAFTFSFTAGYSIGLGTGTSKIDADILTENDYLIKEIDTRDTLIACLATMLHDYYQFFDKEYDTNGRVMNAHNFFYDCISESDAYIIASEILNDNWGNFFSNWNFNPNDRNTINKWKDYGKKE